jgi:shikimate kinase
MVQRIEFIGPMGAGKSTIYTMLKKKMMDGAFAPATVRPAHQQKKHILLAEAKQMSLLHWAALKILVKIPTIEANLITNKITASAWQALWARSEVFGPLIDHALHGRTAESVELIYVLKRMSWFIREVTDVALLEEFAYADVILHDQSLFQCGLTFGFGYEQGKSFIKKYFRLVPASSVLIHVSGQADVLVTRLEQRDGPTSRHMKHVKEGIMFTRIACEVLQERNVPVIEVDGCSELKEIVEHCITELQKVLLPLCKPQ